MDASEILDKKKIVTEFILANRVEKHLIPLFFSTPEKNIENACIAIEHNADIYTVMYVLGGSGRFY